MRITTRVSAFLLAIGLSSLGCEETVREEEPTVTWSGDVRAIVERHCAACHTTGGSAPFGFETHEQVAELAPFMLSAMESGRMPPFPADPSCRPYDNEARLPAADLETFRRWVDEATPEGAATEPIVVAPIPFTATVTATAASPYTPDLSTAGDDYHCFILDLDFVEPTWVTSSNVTPGTPAVHHVLIFALNSEQSAQAEALDAAEAGEGYSCFGGPLPSDGGAMTAASLVSQLASWVPGSEPRILPGEFGIPINPGSRLVMQVHFSAVGGDPQPDLSALELGLTQTAPEFNLRTVPLAIPEIDIPAGATDVTFTKLLTNWSDTPVRVSTLAGHMHLLGDSISINHVDAGGEERCGMSIPDWDFDWQLSYLISDEDPLTLAPLDGLRVRCTYDNSADNQPIVDGVQQSPRNVTWGEGSLDEMCLVYATVIEPVVDISVGDAGGVCAAANDCYAASDGSLSALLACEETSAGCAVCPLQNGTSCGIGPCLFSLASARTCLTDCVLSVNAFGGSMDRCMRASCGQQWEDMLACADPVMQSGSCDANLAAGCDLVPSEAP
jgi:hypothetical protein